MMLGGTDDDDGEDDFEEMQKQEDDNIEGGGGCNKQSQPPPPDLDLGEIEGKMDDTPLLEMESEEEARETKPAIETEHKPALGQGDDKPKKHKLASSDKPTLAGGRDEHAVKDRTSGFHQRKVKRAGGGQLLGGGSRGSAGFIA